MFVGWKEKAHGFEIALNHLQRQYTELLEERDALLEKLTLRIPDGFVFLVLYKDSNAEIVEANRYSVGWHGSVEFCIDDIVILRTFREILSVYLGPKNEMIEKRKELDEQYKHQTEN